MSAHRILGTSPTRVEDERLLRGEGRFVDDIEVPRALHLVFLRSPHAHADILSLSTEAARAMPGVVAVWTGADLAARATTLRMAPPIEGLHPVDTPPFRPRKPWATLPSTPDWITSTAMPCISSCASIRNCRA